jgi:hypothetical protein
VRKGYKVAGVAVVTLIVASSAAVAWSATTSNRRSAQCERVRAQVADREALLDAAVAGGLSEEQKTRVEFERAINRSALRHCRKPEPGPGSGTGGATQPAEPSQSATATPTPTATATTPASPTSGSFPTAANTGVPAGWTPAATHTSDVRVTKAGSVVENVRLVNANLVIEAPNVTVKRVEILGGRIFNDPGSTCMNGLVLEEVSVLRAPGQKTRTADPSAIGTGGYTARKVKVDGLPEAFRVGGRSVGCGPVTIQDSFANVVSPDECGDWHGDGIQGYDGPALTVRNVTLNLTELRGCQGTAPFFYPADQGNTSVDIDRLLVNGGGYPFRLGMPGKVRGLRIVDGSWFYGPIEVKCGSLSEWEAQVASADGARTVKSIPCTTR